ncbi:hypothetical protein BLD50_00190 [Bacillus cereus]|nr:hypothetical protein BLD50_00190 [Bacillus cereus]
MNGRIHDTDEILLTDILSHCKLKKVKKLPKTHSSIGMDVGRKHFAILSDGTAYKNPEFFRSLEETLAKALHEVS